MHIRESNRRYPVPTYLYVRMVVVTSERGGGPKKGLAPPRNPFATRSDPKNIFRLIRRVRVRIWRLGSDIYGVKIRWE